LSKLFSPNRVFITAYLIFLPAATVLLFFMEKGDLVLFFSDHRTPFLDVFFRWFTDLGDGLWFGVIAVVLLFFRYRYAISVAALGLSVMVVSYVSKSIFSLDRPLPYFQKIGLEDQLTFVAGVDVHTGATSFPSGHTMTAFALYGFLAFIFPQKKVLGFFLFLIAIGAGLSRVYLVQHFFQDIYLGSLIGLALALLWWYLQKGWKKTWLDRKLNLSNSKA